jgi:hypothetical protein
MKVKSTGLGKTQLQCHFDGFTKKENGEQSVVMVITSTEPVHWHIEADLGGKDLRQMAGQMLKPATIWHLLKLLVAGSEARGFVMEKEGGRRSSRERASREPVVRTVDVAEVEAMQTVAEPAAAAVTILAAVPDEGVATTPMRTERQAARAAKDESDLSAREQRRAELRRQREETAKQYATA